MALSGLNIVLPKQKHPFCLSKSYKLLYIYTIYKNKYIIKDKGL